ncbi:protocadherin-23 [Thomomys bottae]
MRGAGKEAGAEGAPRGPRDAAAGSGRPRRSRPSHRPLLTPPLTPPPSPARARLLRESVRAERGADGRGIKGERKRDETRLEPSRGRSGGGRRPVGLRARRAGRRCDRGNSGLCGLLFGSRAAAAPAIAPPAGRDPGAFPGAGGPLSPCGRRMGAGRPGQGAPVRKRRGLRGLSRSPRGWPGGGGSGAQRALLGLCVHAWLWASAGSSAQVFNLSLSVDEGLPPDTLVGDLRAALAAAQPQGGDGFLLSEDSDDSPLLDDFHVHPDTGIIRTARRLDRERRDRYRFVAATLLGAVVQVEIRVNDVNDHSPRFPRDSVQLDVSELSPPGTAFRLPGAHDPDAGLFGTQGYTLVQLSDGPEDPEGPFFQLRYDAPGPPAPASSSPPLEPLDLVLLRRLDRETTAAHELQIEAWDGGSPRRRGRLRVELRVLDENDNAPVFQQDEYRAAVREDAPPGAEVCRVRATDRDLGPNGLVRYRIRARPGPRSAGDAAFFTVEELSGAVRVRRPLDREAQAWHQLVIEARDGGAEPEVATARVSIAVLDVNDNRPAIHLLFLTEGAAPRVSEGARPGDYVARVSVSDADGDPERAEAASGEPGPGLGGGGVSLALEGGEGAFALRPGASPGVFFLCVEGALDRESRDLYELRLVATDAGAPPLSAEETLLLLVTDLNDQPPVFSQELYRASVSEAAGPGTTVLWVEASDGDEPGTDHARLRYALVQLQAGCDPEAEECAPAFAIHPESGAVRTVRALDREAQEEVELRVVARDLGEPPLSATCRVLVTVDDVNDHEPVFPRQVYNVTLAEHAPLGHCFLQVKASDADAGLYGLVEYSLYDGFQSAEAPPAFRIDPRDGRICVSQDIDRERDLDTFDLLVKAKDGGGLSAQAFVRVELEDVNDNRPVFSPSTYVTSISGETRPGTEVINVLARDRDSGLYGTVAYELMPGDLSHLFTIDSTTGIIYLTSAINHLEPTTLFFMVRARDGGGLMAAVNAEVTIHVLQNTLAPAEFEKPKYTFSVYEDVHEDSPVGTVRARESANSSEPIFYRISSGDMDGKFSIHPWLGTIHTQKRLDHESQAAVVLTVQAQLGSSPVYSSTEVNIVVIDVNDNPPEFPTACAEIRIPQTTPPGTALYLARAQDKDSGPNGLIWYTIASPSPSLFTIDSRLGLVFLHGNLGGHVPQTHTLTIMAEDHGAPARSSRMVLTVAVEKQEQRATLTFENLVYQVEVHESLPVMAQLLQIQAWPLVPPHPHSQVVYSLEASVESAAFGIHPHTGWIYLRRQLDYESTRAYSLRAFAWIPEDRLVQNGSTSVTVHVLDENDNSPTFLHGPLFLKVLESPVPLGVIGQITAVDSDFGKNGQLSYFLLSDGKFFKLNPNTGELVSWSALDREEQGYHQLTVLVTDHGSPPRNATTVVYVTVIDTNDNRPFFPQCLPGKEFYIKVLEGQPVNTLVTTVFAKDLDEGSNAEVSYSISPEDYSDHFKIDSNNGEIRTSLVLSHDCRPSYRMTVIASDQGVPPLQGQAVVNIQVLGLPGGGAFSPQSVRHLVLPEDLKPTKLLSLAGPAPPAGGPWHFGLAPEDRDPHFQLDSSTGDLFLARELDFERTPRYLLRVTARPGDRTLFLSIDVDDRNDHAPAFPEGLVVLGVEEDAAPGTLLHNFTARDGDGGFLNSRLRYSTQPQRAGASPFLIHPSRGSLVTAAALDRERLPRVPLTVTASDRAANLTDRRRRSLLALVLILDVNDHSPAFLSPPEASVREDAAVGAAVHRVRAHDPDQGRNGSVTYSILSGGDAGAFVLDAASGLLTTARPLDYEIRTQYILTIVAQDGGNPALSSSQMVTVTVLDVNDQVPLFMQPLYEASVQENQSPGTFVTRVEAEDRDSGINSQLQFEIMPGASSGFFTINPDSGEVITTTILDREVQDVFTLLVLVRDRGVPELSSTTTILCTVEDENDHAPEFIVPDHDIEVLENQEPEVVYTVWASDRDAGNNGTVRYHIIHGNTNDSFAIHEMSGELSTTHALNREQISNFTLFILCSDLGHPARSSVLQLQVRVLDANDNSPSFSHLYYQSSVREDAPIGTVVLVLSAMDRDVGPNGQIEYFLLDESSRAFTIDSTAGILRTSLTLDRETTSQYTFRAVARDCSILGPRSTIVTVNIAVTDANDNDPVLEQNLFDIFLSPQFLTNQTVAFVKAHDPDVGPNGTVTFSFADSQSIVSIDTYTGEITLLQNLSSEYFPIWLPLRVTDQGAPARATTGLVVIHMEGEAVKVSFSHHLYKGLVMENCEAGTSVVTVKAFVPDSIQDSIEYSIFSGNEDGIFSLGSKSGHLTVKEPRHLDFEIRSEIQLIILAESSGQGAYSKVVVKIQDVNDNFPRFGQKVYQASVSEGQPYNTHVIQVFATDPDSGLNGLIEYSFLHGNEEETFHIEAMSGVITTEADLDYESTSSYSLIVQATDRGVPPHSDTAVINVQVTDRNDNSPTLLPLDAVEIAEDSLPGVTVSRVFAHDVDANPAFIFTISKASNAGTKFAIDQNTGEVVLVQPLDFEEATEYELFIQVSDSVHHTEGSLLIHVLDVNDNPPVFSQEIYQVTVPESVPLGHSVLSVSATDLESNENISYRILSSQEFAIDPVNGTIFTINPVLLLDKRSAIRFLVEASDGGIPPLKALTLVEIKIADLNDHAPEFPVEFYNLSLSEDTPIGSTLITFSTTDHDWTLDNTHVEYFIISGQSHNIFSVETGFLHSEYPLKQVASLVLLRDLDREASDSHQLVIQASDRGCPPLSSTMVVSIQVLDVNDSPPEFTSLEYHAHVKESTPTGSHITMISAHDSDVGSNADIIYDIISGNEKGHFHLEAKTGVFYLIKPLDYEEIIQFTVTVRASDKERRQFAFAVVWIHILDDNDHRPQFLSSSVNCVVVENQPIPFTICSVNAVDLDSGPYGEVTYSILSPCFVTHGMSPAHDLFVIDSFTGDIQATQILDYERTDSYCFMVQAKDRGDLTASLMVWVEVEGVDEFEPIFTQDQYFFSLPAKSGRRQLLGRVEASDADAGTDGIVLYSLETASPYFSVNKTNGNIYWMRTSSFLNSQMGKEDTFEIKIMAHSPKPGSKFTLCSVFVNGSFSSAGNLATVSVHTFSISLTVSSLVFLFFFCALIFLMLRHKQKEDRPHSHEEEKTSNLETNLQMVENDSVPPAFREVKEGGDEAGPGGTMPEWLGLISILQKDAVHFYGHSNSSGRCSVEGETAEDKEIQQINEHPYRKDLDSPLSDRGSRVPDSGIPRDSDQLSCLSGETDVMASAEATGSSHNFEGGDRSKGLMDTPNKELPRLLQKRDTSQEVQADGWNEFISEDQEASCATFSRPITCDHDVRSNDAWNYLLRWEPKFQPLASVFNDLAKLKDESVPTPGILKKKSSVCLPPLITAVAQPGIKAVPPRLPAMAPVQVLHRYPRSPILYHGSSPPEAMSPSFSFSSIHASATLPELLGTHQSGTCLELEAGDEIQT